MPSIDWSKLITFNYWLEGLQSTSGSSIVTPVIDQSSWFFWFYVWLFSGLVILGIILRLATVFLDKKVPTYDQLPLWSNNIIWMGVLGIGWFTARQLSVAFIGARFWLIIGFVWFLIILGLAIRYFIQFFPLELKYYLSHKKNNSKV
jgi:hypothetical protein